MDRILRTASISLLFNAVFCAYHIGSGILTHSWWLLTLGAYYAILSIVRFVVLLSKRQDRFVARFTGVMLMLLSIPLVGTVVLAVIEDRGSVMDQIVMIAMAAYAFTKITLAIINLVRSRRISSAKHITLRNISFADACVSIFALQRSMLVSFGDMSEENIFIFNVLLGSAVCIVAFLLGLNLVMIKKTLFISLREKRETLSE